MHGINTCIVDIVGAYEAITGAAARPECVKHTAHEYQSPLVQDSNNKLTYLGYITNKYT